MTASRCGKSSSFLFLAVNLLVLLSLSCVGPKGVEVRVAGEALAGLYWEPPEALAAAVLLVHGPGESKEGWLALGNRLQGSGYAALAIDLRGLEPGDSAVLTADIAAGFEFLREQKKVDAARIGLIGSDLGASGVLNFSAQEPLVQLVVLLSPAANAPRLGAEAAMAYYGWRPVLFAASRDDLAAVQAVEELAGLAHGSVAIKFYEGAAHGIALLRAAPALERALLNFLETHLRPSLLETSGVGG